MEVRPRLLERRRVALVQGWGVLGDKGLGNRDKVDSDGVGDNAMGGAVEDVLRTVVDHKHGRRGALAEGANLVHILVNGTARGKDRHFMGLVPLKELGAVNDHVIDLLAVPALHNIAEEADPPYSVLGGGAHNEVRDGTRALEVPNLVKQGAKARTGTSSGSEEVSKELDAGWDPKDVHKHSVEQR